MRECLITTTTNRSDFFRVFFVVVIFILRHFHIGIFFLIIFFSLSLSLQVTYSGVRAGFPVRFVQLFLLRLWLPSGVNKCGVNEQYVNLFKSVAKTNKRQTDISHISRLQLNMVKWTDESLHHSHKYWRMQSVQPPIKRGIKSCKRTNGRQPIAHHQQSTFQTKVGHKSAFVNPIPGEEKVKEKKLANVWPNNHLRAISSTGNSSPSLLPCADIANASRAFNWPDFVSI